MNTNRVCEADIERRVLLEHYYYMTRFANDIILLLDREWNILEANDRAVLAYGYTHSELLQMNANELRSPENRAVVDKLVKQVEKQGGLVYETAHLRKDGSSFPVEVSS
ncbi:MAG: PAS domain S-box protein, partial [Firmicutes bacterium]|nr:PAS domain S-box protein [Bacillota bacterium]